ncbi:MAG: oligosaccharide flippase family protein [Desulfobacter sp.]
MKLGLRSANMPGIARAMLDSGLNMALRGLTLASKFFLMVYLAKVLPPEQLGVYGLFTVTISYALYFCGLDFYTYAQREMLSLPRDQWGTIIRNQFAFYGVVYLVVLPLLLLVFVAGVLPWQMIGWFYLLLTLEHLSQELSRLLVACGKVTLTNIVLFFRSGAWVFAVIAIYRYNPDIDELWPIWTGWSCGVAFSMLIAIYAVRRLVGQLPAKVPIDWHWIRKGLKTAGQFLVGTLALRGLFTFDRYFLDLYAGKSAVGVYSFYMSFANAMMAFADAGIISKMYPKIVVAYRTGRYEEYKDNLKKLGMGIIALYFSCLLVLLVVVKPVLHYIGKDIFSSQIGILWVLLAAMAVYSLSLIPHYALYAHGSDRQITFASVFALFIFVISAIFLTPSYGTVGISFSIFISMVGLLAIKGEIARRAHV